MNGAHDLGGAHGFGPVIHEPDEPVFHVHWERHAFALTIAMGATGAWPLDAARHARESLPPARYLSSSYYEIWLLGLQALLLERGLVTREELERGAMMQPPVAVARTLRADAVAAALARGSPTERPARAEARFAPGDAVRAVNRHPASHTRLPRYVRGHRGVIESAHGAHVFPDTLAHGLGEQPHWLYTVRFDARELWGPDTTADSVCVDCWEPYLELDPASGATAGA